MRIRYASETTAVRALLLSSTSGTVSRPSLYETRELALGLIVLTASLALDGLG